MENKTVDSGGVQQSVAEMDASASQATGGTDNNNTSIGELNSSQEEICPNNMSQEGQNRYNLRRKDTPIGKSRPSDACLSMSAPGGLGSSWPMGTPHGSPYGHQFISRSQVQIAHQQQQIQHHLHQHRLQLQLQQSQQSQTQQHQMFSQQLMSHQLHQQAQLAPLSSVSLAGTVNESYQLPITSTPVGVNGTQEDKKKVASTPKMRKASTSNIDKSSKEGEVYKKVQSLEKSHSNIGTTLNVSSAITSDTNTSSNIITMPTTTITTTTSAVTCKTGNTTGTMTVGSILSTTTTTVTDDPKPSTTECLDSKRKRRSEEDENSKNESPKRRKSDSDVKIESNYMLQKMFQEMMGMKNGMDNVGTQIALMNNRMEQMQQDNNIWKSKLAMIEKDCSDLKISVEMAHNLVRDESKKREDEVKSIRNHIAQHSREGASNVQLLKTHGDQLKSLDNSVKGINSRIDTVIEEHKQMAAPMENLRSKVENALGEIDFPVNKTIVAQNVWYTEGENLDKIVELIVNTTLELPDVTVRKIERKSGFEKGSGLLKIELGSENDVKKVLKNKRKLMGARAPELIDIYLRNSKSNEVLLAEKNQDTILREMGVRNAYVRLPTGYLAKKSNRYQSGGRDNGRQQGRSRGGRGGRGSNGRGHGGQNSRWHSDQRNHSDSRETPADIPIADLLA